jgi:hypothetical protein
LKLCFLKLAFAKIPTAKMLFEIGSGGDGSHVAQTRSLVSTFDVRGASITLSLCLRACKVDNTIVDPCIRIV